MAKPNNKNQQQNNRPGNQNNQNNRPGNNQNNQNNRPGNNNNNNNNNQNNRPGNNGGQQVNTPVTPANPGTPPRFGVGAQQGAMDNYNTQTAIRAFADAMNGKGLKIGDQGALEYFNRELTKAEQDYLFNYAGSQGYGFGNAFGERYKDQTAVDPGDPSRPYNPGGYNSAMVDGRITNKEINNRIDKKAEGKDNYNRNNAYLRITNRWSGKDGSALSRGVLKNYTNAYQEKNPALGAWDKYNTDNPNANNGPRAGLGTWDNFLTGKNKDMYDLFSNAYQTLRGKEFRKGDVFSRLNNGSFRAGSPVVNQAYIDKFGQAGFGSIGINDGTGTTGTGTGDGINTGQETPVEETPETPAEEKASVFGGNNSAVGQNNLGFQRNKSSWASNGRNRKGAGILGRTGFKSGLSIR